jgi:hypothetical protein
MPTAWGEGVYEKVQAVKWENQAGMGMGSKT